jgi:hypothetical protein
MTYESVPFIYIAGGRPSEHAGINSFRMAQLEELFVQIPLIAPG